MRYALVLSLLLASGCASYTRAKIDLTAQIRRGIESTRAATTSRQAVLEQFAEAQSARLDDAFDADVRQRASLSADWVIAHRKAYIAVRSAMDGQKHSLRIGQATIESNLDAIDRALDELQQMHAIEDKFNLPEVMK